MLNENRKKLVHLAFRKLDTDGSGAVEFSEIKSLYNASSHPDVIMNKRTEQEVLIEFMQAFQVQDALQEEVAFIFDSVIY